MEIEEFIERKETKPEVTKMYLQNGSLAIRPATAKDAATLACWWNDGEIMAHAGFPNGIYTTAAEVARSLKTDTDWNRRLILELEGTAIGEMNYRTVADNTAEIGIKICDVCQREKGFGTQYLSMLITYLFDQGDYRKILLDTNLRNIRAQHVYEKIGFRRVAVHMNAWTDQLGVPQSYVDYELIREWFRQLRGCETKPADTEPCLYGLC
ncbi:GNAT family N-acetyltransferase [Gorillibacterium massiliense]|uniref:GNAT family N-acetyltransferase n=1 Tax=Gorillibacterium massiliense TaxID=1280390 RepID=UPI0004B52EC3|nr:GNAT family protein [Gorillibacterium massiliense]